MPTVVDIANLALTACGSEDVLITMDDVNKAGRLCRKNYDFARRAVLAKHNWKFSIVRVAVDLYTTEVPAFGWSSQFQVPDDYIKAVTVNDRYEEWVREGRFILSNDAGPINLRYVSDVQAVEVFDPLFIDAVALDLAVRIAYSLTQSDSRDQTIKQAYKDVISKARFADSIEQSMQRVSADEYIDARLSNRDYIPGG